MGIFKRDTAIWTAEKIKSAFFTTLKIAKVTSVKTLIKKIDYNIKQIDIFLI